MTTTEAILFLVLIIGTPITIHLLLKKFDPKYQKELEESNQNIKNLAKKTKFRDILLALWLFK